MTDHEVTSTDERLDPIVERAAALLRRPEPVGQAWRDALMASVAVPAQRRGTTMRVWVPLGIAAAVSAVVGVQRLNAGNGGDQVRFAVSAPSAKRVSLVGDFNGWNQAGEQSMRSAGKKTETYTTDHPCDPLSARHLANSLSLERLLSG